MTTLRNCDACHRHVMAQADVCPFCHAALGLCEAPASNTLAPTGRGGAVMAVALGVGLMLSACGRPGDGGVDESGESSEAESEPTTTAESSAEEASSTESSGDSSSEVSTSSDDGGVSGGFYAGWGGEDMGNSEPSCDPWEQSSCPEGEKCTVKYDLEWANVCRPITGDLKPGDPCFTEQPGSDDCAAGSFCFGGGGEEPGVCIELCSGSMFAPECPQGQMCWESSDGILPLCLDTCDPLMPECPESMGCLPADNSSGQEGFACMRVISPAPDNSCIYSNGCAPGFVCRSDDSCGSASSCCRPYCDATAPESCADPDLTCQPVYPDGAERPEWEIVGICLTP